MENQHQLAPVPADVHSDRPAPKKRPLEALGHFRELVKDKENTEHVFRIFDALPRQAFRDDARAFASSEKGHAIYASESYLPDLLDDHERLRAMPKDSVAHAYCDFMEAEGLTSQGLVDEELKSGRPVFGDCVDWYGARNRDVHDLLHVLTGYGRDPIGEQCVLAFTYGQDPSPANIFIAYAGGLHVRKTTKTKAPVLRAINEAKRLGKGCPRVCEENIANLLAEPLETARERLNITRPSLYWDVHRILAEEGRDPHVLMGQLEGHEGAKSLQVA